MIPDSLLAPGQVCAAIFPEDHNWHRAVIIDTMMKDDNFVQVSHWFVIQSEFFITMNALPEYSTSDKNFLGTDFSLSKLLRYNGKHAYRHRQ